MARIRTIKPEFFLDSKLADLDLRARLTFIGLWTLADKAGRLKDNARRIRAELFPYEPRADVEAALSDLASATFIIRYEVGGSSYIQVRNFDKHQRPHIREAPSDLPGPGDTAPPAPDDDEDVTYLIKDGHGMVKVGRSCDVKARMLELSTGSSSALELLMVIPGGWHEGVIHGRFAGARARGEWFAYSDELLEFAAKLRDKPNPPPTRRSASQGLHGGASTEAKTAGSGKGMDLGNGSGEGEGEGEGKGREGERRDVELTLDRAVPEPVARVFAQYRLHHPRSFPKPDPKSKEWRQIQARLTEGYSVDDLCQSIDGYHRSPFHQGENDRQTKYLGLELFMRDGTHVQKGIEFATRNGHVLNEGTLRGVRAGTAWLERKGGKTNAG